MCHKLSGSKQDFDGIKMMMFLLSLFQPKIVEALLGYELIQVSCGASHVLAVTNEREVFAWGRGENGTIHQSLLFTFSQSVLQMSVSCYLAFDLHLISETTSSSLVFTAGRLGLGTQDTHNAPQQVCLPVEFEANRVVCGVDCSIIIGSQYSILACGSNR